MAFRLKCSEVTQLLSERMDRRLGLWERFSLRVHLFLCGPCRHYAEQIPFLTSAVKKLFGGEGRPVGLDESARERIRAKLSSR